MVEDAMRQSSFVSVRRKRSRRSGPNHMDSSSNNSNNNDNTDDSHSHNNMEGSRRRFLTPALLRLSNNDISQQRQHQSTRTNEEHEETKEEEEDDESPSRRKALFFERLPLHAPRMNQNICSVCNMLKCQCDDDSNSNQGDDGEGEEEPLSRCEKCLEVIRAKTDVIRYYSGCVVNDQVFQIFVIVLILLNSILIGISTADFVEDNTDIARAFWILDLVFLIIFTIELIMQFLYHGYGLFLDGWLLFDFFIVFMGWAFESISVLRALRLRSFRIFRVFRLTSRIRALRRLVEAIFDVMPKITAIAFLFGLLMYIFAVMCTELFGDIDFTGRFTEPNLDQYDYFSRLDYTFFTLFQMVTLDWGKITRAVMQVYPWASALFVIFVICTAFVLYNLIIAVVCDAVKMVQDQHDVIMVEEYVKDNIESRHRIINLRQKLDKMSKQQIDLLLYVQLIVEQLDDIIDESSKMHYEETLLLLGQSSENAKEALQKAISQLQKLDVGHTGNEVPQMREKRKQAARSQTSLVSAIESPIQRNSRPDLDPESRQMQQRVSFSCNVGNNNSRSTSVDVSNKITDPSEAQQVRIVALHNEPGNMMEDESLGQFFFGAAETMLDDGESDDGTFQSCKST